MCTNIMHFVTDFYNKTWKEYVYEQVLWLDVSELQSSDAIHAIGMRTLSSNAIMHSNTTFLMACIASNSCNSCTSNKTTNYKSDKTLSCNWCSCHLWHNQINHHFINLHAMSRTSKQLKLRCFSVFSLYTQLHLVLYPNNSNINFIQVTMPCPMHIPSILHF